MKTELKKIESWLSGLPEGEISPGQYASVSGDKIEVMSTWNGTHTETLSISEFKNLYPYGKLYGYPWE